MKYLILRVRAKISFIAMEKRITIVELIIKAIISTYEKMQLEGAIPKVNPTVINI